MLSYRVFILKNIAFICFFNILNERKINQLKEINCMKKKKEKYHGILVLILLPI